MSINMEWNRHQTALKDVLTNLASDFGEAYVGKFIAETVGQMDWKYNSINDTLTDIAKESMMEIDPDNPSPEVYQLEGYVNRLMHRIKEKTN